MNRQRPRRTFVIPPPESLDERIVPAALDPIVAAANEALVASKGGQALGSIYQEFVNYEQAVTPFLNNAATVLLMVPIGASLATRLGLNPDAFLMAVAVGAAVGLAALVCVWRSDGRDLLLAWRRVRGADMQPVVEGGGGA